MPPAPLARSLLALTLLAAEADAQPGPEAFALSEWRVPGRAIDAFAARGEDGREMVFAISLGESPPLEHRYLTAVPSDLAAPARPVAVPNDVVVVDAAELGLAPGPELVLLSASRLRILAATGAPLAELPIDPPAPLPARTWELSRVELVRDWDADGRPEVLVPSAEGARLLALAPGDSGHALELPLIADYGSPTLENYFRPGLLATIVSWPTLELADDDGDGRADLFAANRYELRVFRSGADGLPRTATRIQAFPPFTPEEERRHLASTLLAFVRDLDGDRRADLIVHRMVGELARSRSTTSLHRNHGAGADPLAPPEATLELSGGNAALRLADVDGDGRLELLEAYLGFGVVQAVRMLTLQRIELRLRILALPVAGSGTPTPTWSDDVSFPFDFSTTRVRGVLPFTEADWNADGRIDLCWGDASGLLRFRLGEARPDGPRFGDVVASVPLAISGDLVGADLDGDGLPDFVAFDPLDREGRLRIGRNRGVWPGMPPGLRAPEGG